MEYKVAKDDYIHGGTQKDFYTDREVEKCNCPLCGSTDFVTIYKERGSIGLAQCKACNLVYANPRVINAEENYHGDASVYFEEARLIFKGKKKHHRDRNYEYELQEIKKFKPTGKLLDIGTNMGFFLRKAKEFGFEVEGVEPSPSLSKIAFEQFSLKIHNDYFMAKDFAAKSMDVITMIDVFEHVTNPRDLLSSAHQVLKDDGIMCIKVPNANYNILKLKLAQRSGREASHDIFNSYEHVVHYTPETMKAMLKTGGFRIKKLILPLPIHPPLWSGLVGHYYQYPSPAILDWKRILVRNIFYNIGKLQKLLGLKISFAPDLMFIIEKEG
ncbi:MAG: class I SAM-dependent methyltransferase [Bacteroidota bacterium]